MSLDEWPFAAEPSSPGMARRRTREALEQRGLHHAVDVAVLVVSELATNAILHARTDFDVRLSFSATHVRIEVHDGSNAGGFVRHFTAQSTSGRGLRMVESVAESWGIERNTGAGKTIWAELPVGDDRPPIVTFDLASVEAL